MSERFKQIVTVHLMLINKNNQVLLQKRCNTGYMDNMYAFVSGHLESNESLLQGVIRETREEVGIKLEDDKVRFVCFIRRASDNNYINSYFMYKDFDGDIINMEPEKCSELKWFDIDALPKDIIPNDKRAIYNMKNNIYLDEYGFDQKR